MRTNRSVGTISFHVLNYFFLSLFAFICVYPFYYIFIYTISSPEDAGRGIALLPVHLTLSNYNLILSNDGIISAFIISASRTLVGTVITLFFCTIFAFVMTHKETLFRTFMYRVTIASLYVSAGLIPWFLVMRAYELNNNFLLYVLPSAMSGYFVLLIKVYIEQLPASLEESAVIDGAGYFTVFLKIIIPLSMPILAAVGVFAAVNQWNSFFDNLILVENPKLQTLQYLLYRVLDQSEALARQYQRGETSTLSAAGQAIITPTAVKMTITMVATIPVLLIYPFLQRYFVKGILLGAVKG
ncbi:carbohydrate ABC transporter permease [Paenibacillus psychroresistens]|uniref:Carbohydrate ABC transporter permease n=1 Tax=Paenibacillus psychroresistens TaxID=1778678 RepID=A0A6B8RHW9_9BACL|nr:carbohydrate ABC transporter permease [Paenibacillus psychroresistens]QGQ95133.1 carbohydrate ABC transporter permease [Paenibacillus psychroresistens]